jgi:predicted nucleic acid-binding protein
MAAGYLIDTNIASYGIDGRSEVLRLKLRHAPPSKLFISSVTAAELLYEIKRFSLESPATQNVKSFPGTSSPLKPTPTSATPSPSPPASSANST